MKRETAIASGMKRAGVDTDEALLYSIAVDMLRKNNFLLRRALNPFVDEVIDAGGIMAALISRKQVEIAGIEYLQRVAWDMKGKDLKVPAKAGAGGNKIDASNGSHGSAPRDNSPEGDGRGNPVGASNGNDSDAPADSSGFAPGGEAIRTARDGATLSLPLHTLDDGNGNVFLAREGIGKGALPSSSESAVRVATKSTPEKANTAAPSHGAPRNLADMKRIREVSPTIFDTRKLRDGTPIGDLRWSQLDRFVSDNAQEAALLNLIRKHTVPADRNARVREVISLETLQRLVQKSAEVCDAVF